MEDASKVGVLSGGRGAGDEGLGGEAELALADRADAAQGAQALLAGGSGDVLDAPDPEILDQALGRTSADTGHGQQPAVRFGQIGHDLVVELHPAPEDELAEFAPEAGAEPGERELAGGVGIAAGRLGQALDADGGAAVGPDAVRIGPERFEERGNRENDPGPRRR